jgi:multiple sugar transport system permease protein/raffinose/stachyose/melibiose transport system permease protein
MASRGPVSPTAGRISSAPLPVRLGDAPAAEQPRSRPRRRRLRWQPAYLFLAPSLTILLVFVVYPVVQSLWISLHDWRLGAPVQPWVGSDNYRALARDPLLWNALRVTLVFSAVSVAIQVVLGFLLASWLQGTGRLVKLLRSVYFFPTIVALASIGLVWRFLLDPQIGLVAGWTAALGLRPVDWLQSTTWALPAVVFVAVWKNLGFTMVLLLAGLQGIPAHLYEAARLDGAGRWQLMRHVTLPGLRPALLFTTVILTINSLQTFDLVYVMTRGGPLFTTDTLVTYMYRQAFENFRFGYAAAVAWVLFSIILLLSALQLRLFRHGDVD